MSISKLRCLIRQSTALLRDIARLFSVAQLVLATGTAIAVTVAPVLVQKPPVPPPVLRCSPVGLSSAVVREADRRFYERHPEISRRVQIQPADEKLAREWWGICDDVLNNRPSQPAAKRSSYKGGTSPQKRLQAHRLQAK